MRLLDGIRVDGNDTHFAVARDGTLVYVPELSRESRLVWDGREGSSRPLDIQPRRYPHPRISPDGTRVILNVPRESGELEIWIYDAARGTRTRLGPIGSRPIWTADGQRVTFHGREPVLGSGRRQRPAAARARAGRSIQRPVSTGMVAKRRCSDVQCAGSRDEPRRVDAAERQRDYAIPHDASGRTRGHVLSRRPLGGLCRQRNRTRGTGVRPAYPVLVAAYRSRQTAGSARLVANGPRDFLSLERWHAHHERRVHTERTLTIGDSRVLFAGRFTSSDGSYWSNYDVSRDGQEFVMLEADQASTPRLNVVLTGPTR